MSHLAARGTILAVTLALAGSLGACSSGTTQTPSASDNRAESSPAYPLTVENCDEEVLFDEAPQRVVLLESAPVTILDGLGVLDRVVSRAGSFPSEYYDSALARRVDDIETLSQQIDATGHVAISSEVILAQQPDLVLGLPEGVTREGLLDSGVNTLVQPVYCPSGVGDASFESLYEQIRVYGEIFDRRSEAELLISTLARRVAAVEAVTSDRTPRSAAVLYPSTGGGQLYAYGRASMSQPQLEAAGFTNVFADTSDRVFEVSIEELVDRDPDVLILLYQGDDRGVLEEVSGLPGAEALRAVQNGDLLVQLFNFTEPPTPLAVTGLEQLAKRFGGGS